GNHPPQRRRRHSRDLHGGWQAVCDHRRRRRQGSQRHFRQCLSGIYLAVKRSGSLNPAAIALPKRTLRFSTTALPLLSIKCYIRYIPNNSMNAVTIKQSLEDNGLRCTPQRYAVMTFLMECDQHPTAAEIFDAVNRVDPRSSRATTYNNLRDLVHAGLVREVAV